MFLSFLLALLLPPQKILSKHEGTPLKENFRGPLLKWKIFNDVTLNEPVTHSNIPKGLMKLSLKIGVL